VTGDVTYWVTPGILEVASLCICRYRGAGALIQFLSNSLTGSFNIFSFNHLFSPPSPSQECIRYNSLLAVMERSLKETVKALKGLVVMSPELEGVAYAMYDNQVGQSWLLLRSDALVHSTSVLTLGIATNVVRQSCRRVKSVWHVHPVCCCLSGMRA
jgi:hypothetical protein